MVEFLGVILVPIGNFNDDVGGAVGNGLAAEARLRGDTGSFVQLVELGVGGFVAGFETFPQDHMARGASTDASASVVEASLEALGDVENAARKTIVTVRNFLRVHFDGFAAGKKCDFVFLRGGVLFDFFDVRIAATHDFPPNNISKDSGVERPLQSRMLKLSATGGAPDFDSLHKLKPLPLKPYTSAS